MVHVSAFVVILLRVYGKQMLMCHYFFIVVVVLWLQ